MNAAPIQITVSSDLSCSAQHVYDMLWHCERFSEWWPVRVTNHGEQAIIVHPVPLVSIQMNRIAAEPPRRIVYEYVTGPFRGEGEWSIRELPNGAHVDYTIRLRPVNALIALGASTPMFRFKHRQDILAIMGLICGYSTVL